MDLFSIFSNSVGILLITFTSSSGAEAIIFSYIVKDLKKTTILS